MKRTCDAAIAAVALASALTATSSGGASLAKDQARDLVIFQSTPQLGFSVVPAHGGFPHLVTKSGITPVWSPNGRWIAFVDARHIPKSHPCRTDDDVTCPPEVYVVRPDGTGERRVTPPASGTINPVWSPDSRKLVVSKSASLYLVNATGTEFRVFIKPRYHPGNASWAPDGKRIAFAGSLKQGGSDIFVTDLSGRVRQITQSANRRIGPFDAPLWSPNGRWIAAGACRPYFTGSQELYLIPPRGGKPRVLTRTSASPYEMEWSPDSARIAYIKDSELDAGLFTVEVTTSRTRRLTPRRALESWSGPSWSPTGAELVVTRLLSGGPDGVWIMSGKGANKHELIGRSSFAWGWQPHAR